VSAANGLPHADVRIVQLYEHIELYREGSPYANTLFVLGRERGPNALFGGGDQTLLIDPPPDAAERFRFDGQVSALYTVAGAADEGFLTVQTVPGGVAHIRIGNHYLDIYSERGGTLIALPAIGLLYSGGVGSDSVVPVVGEGSDGSAELDVLVAAARLVKGLRLQLMIPRYGEWEYDKAEALHRLAGDVAYLHRLRRVLPAQANRNLDAATLLENADSLLPADRSNQLSREIHRANVRRLTATFHAGGSA